MSTSVSLISTSLTEYQSVIGESKTSMVNLQSILTNTKNNLPAVLHIASIIFTLFFLWLLAVQVVIFSQGLELFHGTATKMATREKTVEKEIKPINETKES